MALEGGVTGEAAELAVRIAMAAGSWSMVARSVRVEGNEEIRAAVARHARFAELVCSQPDAVGAADTLDSQARLGVLSQLRHHWDSRERNLSRLAVAILHLAGSIQPEHAQAAAALALDPEVFAVACAVDVTSPLAALSVLRPYSQVDDAWYAQAIAAMGPNAQKELISHVDALDPLGDHFSWKLDAGDIDDAVDLFDQWSVHVCRLLAARLRGEDERAMELAVALQTNWCGTIGELAVAAKACAES